MNKPINMATPRYSVATRRSADSGVFKGKMPCKMPVLISEVVFL
jgi:hypothetical protein